MISQGGSFFETVRGKILIAFIAVTMITGGLGLYACVVIERSGRLVSLTFDQSLMAINYARAASADFAAMQVASSRVRLSTDRQGLAALETEIAKLSDSLAEDLKIASDRSQSEAAARAGRNAERAAMAWIKERRALVQAAEVTPEAWARLDKFTETVSEEIDLLINHTAGNGFLYRQRALDAVSLNYTLTAASTGFALLLSAMVAWLLGRRIIGPLATASTVAKRIAAGELDGAIPRGAKDELGSLLRAMATMRDNIKIAIDREVSLRRSAQMSLAEALENSREGIIVVDASDVVTLANSQAKEFFGDHLIGDDGKLSESLPVRLASDDEHAGTPQNEVRLADGRWLRVARNRTQESGFIALFSDISLLKDQEEKLVSANVLLDAALDNMTQGLCLYDADRRLKVFNRRFCEIFSIAPESLTIGIGLREVLELAIAAGNHPGKTVDMLIAEKYLDDVAQTRSYLMDVSGGRAINVIRHDLPDGGWVATYEDITVRRDAEAKIIYLAHHDPVTGLRNRSALADRIERSVEASQDGRERHCALLCLDLDRFKEVNDTHGHPIGDQLLRAVADRLLACCDGPDSVGRLGGDEFAVLLDDVSDPKEAEKVAQRIVDKICEPYDIDGRRVSVGVSVGIAMAGEAVQSSNALLKQADQALYLAKAEGGGTWRFYDAELDVRLRARSALEVDLRNAIALEQLELHYQPLVNVGENRVAAFEALLRWRHPTRGMVRPADFIPIAEETGLIVPLGDWVLKQACQEALSWPKNTKVSVNVSAAQFNDDRILQVVKDALESTGLPASCLELEITETVVLADSVKTLAVLHALRDLGVSVSMDDFGTGYSSLSYLRSFPFDKIKIDQSFVHTATTKEGSRTIVGAVVALASSLHIKCVAEGVETQQQAQWLHSIGCDELQGYYFSRPVDAEAARVLIGRDWSVKPDPDALLEVDAVVAG